MEHRMKRFPNRHESDELRRLWHAIAAQRRAVKDDARFAGIHGLSLIETGVLDIVAETPEVILREIGASLGLCKSTLTGVVNRLEEQGYLKRAISSRDRRSYGVELTSRGRNAYETHVRFEVEVWKKMLNGLDSEAESRQFLAALRKIVAGLERQEQSE
jgi:MarR family transcriptional regulator, organic hydroperoxide resistance regulator